MTDLFEKLLSLAAGNEAGATGTVEPGADRPVNPSAGSNNPTSPAGRQTINLESLPVRDLDELHVAVAVRKDEQRAKIMSEMVEVERRISTQKLAREQEYINKTKTDLAPLYLQLDALRRQANVGFRPLSAAGRLLKNRKAALRRQLKREGRLELYPGHARELEASPEYRELDPYGAYLRDHRREYCHNCKRHMLPSDWDIVHQLPYEERQRQSPRPMLAIVGRNESRIARYDRYDHFNRLLAGDGVVESSE